jgi:RNA polymerase sigma factor (sigma-70 family)
VPLNHDDLEAFYVASYPRLVRFLSSVTGNRQEAEELAQDAFVKLIPRWKRIQRYEQPEAWLRTVALRSASSRARHRRVVAKSPPGVADRPSDDGPDIALDVRAVMLRLSHDHRVVLALHHGLDLSLDAISAELGVPVGTVKSRLARARMAFVEEIGSRYSV